MNAAEDGNRRARCRFGGVLVAAVVLSGCAGDPQRSGFGSNLQSAPASTLQPATAMQLADEVRQGGDLDTASALYRSASREQPEDPLPLLRLGDTEFQRGQYDRAAGAYRAALGVTPDDPAAQLGLARSLVASGRPRDALVVLDAATFPAKSREAGDALAARGVALDMLGRHAEAQALYRAGLAATPRDLRLQNNLALSLLMSGDAAAAIEMLRQAAADPLADERHRRNLAFVLAATGDETGAERALQPLPAAEVRAVLQAGRDVRNGGGKSAVAALGLGVVPLP